MPLHRAIAAFMAVLLFAFVAAIIPFRLVDPADRARARRPGTALSGSAGPEGRAPRRISPKALDGTAAPSTNATAA